MKEILGYIKNNKIISIFNLEILLVLFVPYSIIYSGTSEIEQLTWQNIYVFKELNLFIFFIPLSALTILFQLVRNRNLKKTIIILHLLQCGAYSLVALVSMSLPMQDYVPSWGTLIMATLGPMMLIITIIEFRNK